MDPRRATWLLAALAVAASVGCTSPATEVLVVLATDVPASVPLSVTVTVHRGVMSPGDTTRTWTRASLEGGTDGGVTFPASFAIVPGDGNADAAAVTLRAEGNAGGVLIRRTAAVQFVPHATLTLPIFLTVRCATPATGCRDADGCTVQRRCEDDGQTCGNDGTCVGVPVVPPGQGIDASFDDVAPFACGRFHELCCPVGAACEAGMQCVAGRCQVCPDPDEVCCNEDQVMPDGTICAPAVDPCHVSGTCNAGSCEPATRAPDGTHCGDAPDNCHTAPMCSAGVCQPARSVDDGTVCANSTNTCQVNGTCRAGLCTGLGNAPDGTVCASATNACLRNGTCAAGVCSGVQHAPDGTVCATAQDACHRNGTCANGVCGAVTNAPNGTVCLAAANECQTAGTCTSGRCGARGSKADGTAWGAGGLHRCCGGSPVTVNTASNCNACGIRCSGGQSCTRLRGQSQYYCSPCATNASCWSHCCSFYYGNPYACAASDCSGGCISCPGHASCRNVSGDPNYCGY